MLVSKIEIATIGGKEIKMPNEKKLSKAAEWIDNYECNLALYFVLDILTDKDEKINLKTFIDKSKKFGVPLPEINTSSKKLRKTLIAIAKSFRKEKPELVIILACAFKAVVVEHPKQE